MNTPPSSAPQPRVKNTFDPLEGLVLTFPAVVGAVTGALAGAALSSNKGPVTKVTTTVLGSAAGWLVGALVTGHVSTKIVTDN